MPDIDKLQALTTFLSRVVAEETAISVNGVEYDGVAGMKSLSLLAFARMSDGTTIVEVTFEGGSSRSIVNCEPHILLAATEAVIAANDEGNAISGTNMNHRYADMSGGRIET